MSNHSPLDVLGRLELSEILGKGSSGTVHRAFDRLRNQVVAVKEFASGDPTFRNELSILSRLEHPNLVRIFDLLVDDSSGKHYLVEELVEGEDVKTFLRRAGWSERWDVIVQLLRGLEYLHQRGVMHLDVKPSNVRVLTPRHGDPVAKLLDFGIAERIGEDREGETFSGTFPYVAPEVVQGLGLDGRADLYALGMVLYEALGAGLVTHVEPDLGRQVQEALHRKAPDRNNFPPDTPEAFSEVVCQLLAPDPHHRFPTANHVIRYLSRNLGMPFALEPGRLRLPDRTIAFLLARQGELAQLQQRLGAFMVDRRKVHVGLILGGRALGKTALLTGFSLWAKAQDFPVMVLSAPDAKLRDLFHALCREEDRVVLGPLAPYLKSILPAWFGGAPDPEPLQGDPSLEQARVREKLAQGLDFLSRSRKLVLMVDDLASKPELMEFFSYYLRHHAGARASADGAEGKIFVLFTARKEQEIPPECPVDQLVELRPWSTEDLQRILPQILAVDSVPVSFAQAVWERTDGAPGHVVEYLRSIADTLLEPGRDIGAQLAILTEDELKGLRTLPDYARQQFMSLLDVERRILQWICLSPRELSAGDLARLDPMLRVGTTAMLRRLHGEGWLLPLRKGFRVASELRKEAIEEDLSPESRRSIHLRLGEVFDGLPGASALDRAGEFFQGGEIERGFLKAKPELESLLRSNESAGAIHFLEMHKGQAESLPADQRKAYHLILGEAYLIAGNPKKAIDALERAGSGTPLARAYRYGGRLDEARRVVEQGRSVENDPRALIELDALLADILLEQSQYPEAAAIAERYLSDPQAYDADERAAFRHVKAKAHFYRHEYDQAIFLWKQNCAETEKPGGSIGRHALALNSLAIAYLAQGKVDESLRLLHTSAELAQQIGDLRTLALAQVNLGLAYSEKEAGESAARYYELGLASFRKIGDQVNEARSLYNLGILAVQSGDFFQAEDCFSQSLEMARSLNMAHLEATIRLQRAECHLQKGLNDRALAECDKAEQLSRRVGLREEALLSRLKRLEVRLATEGAAMMESDFGTCEQEARALSIPELEAWTFYLKGRILGRREPPDPNAAPCLEQALHRLAAAPTADPALKRKIKAHLASLRAGMDKPTRQSPRQVERPSLIAGPEPTELLSVLEVARDINTAMDTADVLARIVDSMVQFTGADRGFLLLKKGGHLDVQASRTKGSEDVFAADHSFSLTVAQEALSKRDVVTTLDAYEDPRFKEAVSVYNLRLRSVLCVPLFIRGDALGALYLDSRARAGHFEERHIPILRALSDLAATAISKAELIAQNVKSQHELRRTVQELRSSHQQIASLNLELGEANRKLQEIVTHQQQEIETAQHRVEVLMREARPRHKYQGMVGTSGAWKNVLVFVDRAVASQVPVLILGESGTGKELIARAIHFNSNRKQKPFVPVNSAALPTDLFESELFGHSRGAFTGAERDKPGLFEAANEGTLFLDEVGELPSSVQAKLLRVLQDGSVRRLGSTQENRVDVRLVAATNRNLKLMVQEGKFREDLFYRVSVFEIPVPPLRERLEDIPSLVMVLLERLAREDNKRCPKISPQALRALQRHDWPGNVRELENMIQRAYLFSQGKEIEVLPGLEPDSGPAGSTQPGRHSPVVLRDAVLMARKECIRNALQRTGGNVSAAARLLEVDRTQLSFWMKQLKIPRVTPDPASSNR